MVATFRFGASPLGDPVVRDRTNRKAVLVASGVSSRIYSKDAARHRTVDPQLIGGRIYGIDRARIVSAGLIFPGALPSIFVAALCARIMC